MYLRIPFWNHFPPLSVTLMVFISICFVSICEIYLDSGYLVNVARLLVYMWPPTSMWTGALVFVSCAGVGMPAVPSGETGECAKIGRVDMPTLLLRFSWEKIKMIGKIGNFKMNIHSRRLNESTWNGIWTPLYFVYGSGFDWIMKSGHWHTRTDALII